MAKKRERVVALVVVVFFVMTSFGLSLILIWQQTHNNSSSSTPNSTVGTQLPSFTPTDNVPTLKVSDLQTGKGAEAAAGDTISVYYTGALANTGTIFSSTSGAGQAASISLKQVIEGWQLGVPGMKVGGTRRLLIPSQLAYGANPPAGSGIPANTPLVFNITLLSVTKPKK